MKQTDPPRAAAWTLQHLAGECNDALAGDLLEEFRSGRSAAWYWRQAIAAVLIGWGKESLRHLSSFAFAAVWAVFAPLWVWEWMIHVYYSPDLAGPIWSFPWPWSTICDLALQCLLDLAFVWTGLLLFFLVTTEIPGHLKLPQLWRGILRSAFAYVALRLATLLALLLPSSSHPVDWRTIQPLSTIADFTVGSCLERLPFFVAILFAIWGLSRRTKSTQIPARS